MCKDVNFTHFQLLNDWKAVKQALRSIYRTNDLENPFGGNLTVRKTGEDHIQKILALKLILTFLKQLAQIYLQWNDIRNIIAWGAIGDKPTTISDAKSRGLEPSKVTWHFK